MTPRQIRLGGGVVVRALTKVNMAFSADVQYHWRVGTRFYNRIAGVLCDVGDGLPPPNRRVHGNVWGTL